MIPESQAAQESLAALRCSVTLKGETWVFFLRAGVGRAKLGLTHSPPTSLPDKYYRVNLRTRQVDTVSPPYPRNIAQYWLGCSNSAPK